jgi:hypothetical protein
MPSSMGVTHVSTKIKIKKIFFFPLMIPIEYLKKNEKKKGGRAFQKEKCFLEHAFHLFFNVSSFVEDKFHLVMCLPHTFKTIYAGIFQWQHTC